MVSVVREIRATGSNVPMIMITTEAEKERIADAIAAGASDYLVKPFKRESLCAILKNHISDRSSDSSSDWCPQFVPRATAKETWGRRVS
jgi:DNA-binding response OmpR family regulator